MSINRKILFKEFEGSKNFDEYWKQLTIPNRDNCKRVIVERTKFSNVNYTDTRKNTFLKEASKGKESTYKYLYDPPCRAAVAYDIGITGYCVFVEKKERWYGKLVNVTRSHRYKTKPKKIIKNGHLVEMHMYIVSYNIEVYDPIEHNGIPEDDPSWEIKPNFKVLY